MVRAYHMATLLCVSELTYARACDSEHVQVRSPAFEAPRAPPDSSKCKRASAGTLSESSNIIIRAIPKDQRRGWNRSPQLKAMEVVCFVKRRSERLWAIFGAPHWHCLFASAESTGRMWFCWTRKLTAVGHFFGVPHSHSVCASAKPLGYF